MESSSDNFEEKIILSFSLKSCSKGFYYHISIKIEENFEMKEFETEKILCSNERNRIIFEKKILCDFQFEKKQNLIITIHKNSDDNNGSKFERKTTLSSLVQSHMGKYERRISNNSKVSEIISIQLDKDKSQEKENILFDYLKLGLKFSFYFAFDLSQKEKNIEEDFTNISIDILQKLIKVYFPYFKDEHFITPLILGGSINKSNIYTLDKSLISGEEELFNQYKNFLKNKNIISKNKVNLSPFIKKLIDDIYTSYQSNVYSILFIFLSGDINKEDQKETINKIIQSSYLPLNIIVIGIGNHDFSEMKALFLDNVNTTEGMPKNKDNVIFFSIKNKSAIDINLKDYLIELKKQIIDFFNLVKEPQENGINLKDSYFLYRSVVVEYSKEKEGKKINKKNNEILNINNSNNQETIGCNDSINITNKNSNSIYQSEGNKFDNLINSTDSWAPAPVSNGNSYNNNDIINNNNFKSIEIGKEIKIENKIKNDKNYTNAGSAMESTKISDIKDSTSFSIFNHKFGDS